MKKWGIESLIWAVLLGAIGFFIYQAKADTPKGYRPAASWVYDISSGNITTAAYTQIAASTGASCSGLSVNNSSNNPLRLAVGAASAEKEIPYTLGEGTDSQYVDIALKKGVRISAIADTANATNGYLIINCVQ